MRVMVALENRFVKTQNGNIYSTTVCDYTFWRRYLQVFDEVVVLARLRELGQEELGQARADGPNVRFYGLPYYEGPWQYLRRYGKLRALAKKAVEQADAFILRVPGPVASLLWHQLKNRGIPYGIEVVGDLWDSLSVLSVRSILTPIATYQMARNQKKQCCGAIAAAYVSEHYIQRRHFPGGWSTHYSSVELPNEAIVDEDKLRERFASLSDAVSGQRPFRICHVGSMSALYKAQDVLIEAISLCRRAKGLEIQLTLLGDGKYYQHFVEKAKILGIAQNVKFLGRLLPGAPVQKQLDLADLFVLPSLVEGVPRVLIEAMARGLPCIGSNVGGIPELLAPEDMVPAGNAQLLAEKIESVITNIEKLKEMAQRNLQTAKKYGANELNKRRVEFYTKVAEETSRWHANRDK